MSKYNIAVALLGLLLIVVSCHREDIPQNALENTSIEFSGITAWLDTKAEAGANTSALPSDNFKVWAQNGSNYDVFGTNGTKVSTSDAGTTWTYSPVRYWKTGTYNFYAVSPVDMVTGTLSASTSENGPVNVLALSFESWDLSAEDSQTDFLFATESIDGNGQINKTNGPDKVQLTFDHMLSKISFSARNASAIDGVDFTVTSIKVYGISKVSQSVLITNATTATWSLTDLSTKDNAFKTVTHTSPVTLTKETFVEDGVTTNKYTSLCSPFMVFPETSSLLVEVTYNQTYNGITSADTKTATINVSRAAGYEYDFKLRLTEDAIYIDEPSVKQWEDGGSADNTIGSSDKPIEF